MPAGTGGFPALLGDPVLTLLAVVAVAVVPIVVVLVVAVIFADRTSAKVAERKASEYLSAPLGGPAAAALVVSVASRPFLTQALHGCYREVRITGGGLQIGEMTGATLDARLSNVYLSTRELLGRRTEELPCERADGQLVLRYDELARVARIPGLQLTPVGDRMMASAAVPIPGFSQLARVNGEAVWTVGGPGSVKLRIRGLSVAGISVPGLVLSQLLPTLSVAIPLPELPFGLRIDDLRPAADGLVVTCSADAIVFHRRASALT